MLVMYVLIPTHIVALNSEVPDQIWFGKNVNYDHLRVFGCKAFVHVPKDEISKLDAKKNNVSSSVMGKMSLITGFMIL